jgi:hypothetical protein
MRVLTPARRKTSDTMIRMAENRSDSAVVEALAAAMTLLEYAFRKRDPMISARSLFERGS